MPSLDPLREELDRAIAARKSARSAALMAAGRQAPAPTPTPAPAVPLASSAGIARALRAVAALVEDGRARCAWLEVGHDPRDRVRGIRLDMWVPDDLELDDGPPPTLSILSPDALDEPWAAP